jgi:hypothetical protein
LKAFEALWMLLCGDEYIANDEFGAKSHTSETIFPKFLACVLDPCLNFE